MLIQESLLNLNKAKQQNNLVILNEKNRTELQQNQGRNKRGTYKTKKRMTASIMTNQLPRTTLQPFYNHLLTPKVPSQEPSQHHINNDFH